MTDFNEWAAKMNNNFSAIQNENTEVIQQGKEMITRKEVEFDCGYFTFRTRSNFLPRHYRLLSQLKGKEDTTDYDAIQDKIAGVMAELDLDQVHDKQFWLSFDEETGAMIPIFYTVCEELQNNIKSAQAFRKN